MRVFAEPALPGLEIVNSLRLSDGACPEGRAFRELIDKLIELALEQHAEKARTKYQIELPAGSGGALHV